MGDTPCGPSGDRSGSQDDLDLAKKAAAGDDVAREVVVRLIHPLIQYKTSKFCKEFCYGNNRHARCSIDPGWGRKDADTPLCEWGRKSLKWMKETLTETKQLNKYEGKNGATLSRYFKGIINHIGFRERWKNFRFERRVRVPKYIQDISPLAKKIFMWMVDCHPIEMMAQNARVSVEKIEEIADQIIVELTVRGKLHLLDALHHKKTISIISLTGFGVDVGDHESKNIIKDLLDNSWDPEKAQLIEKIVEGLKKLEPIEEFVVTEMVIEEKKAKDVLKSFIQSGMTIKEGVSPEEIEPQELYYFKRKTLAKLKRLSGL